MTDYVNSKMEEAIREVVHNDRHRLILRLRLLDGWTYEAISAHPEVDRTWRQVRNIVERYTAKLFDYMR